MLVSILKYTQKPNRFERGNVMSLQDEGLENGKNFGFP